MIKGVIFDFHGTLAFKKKRINEIKLTESLRKQGYDIYHQEWDAAKKFVFFIEYPAGKIKNYSDFYRRVFKHLGHTPSESIIKYIIGYHKKHDLFALYPDVKYAKALGVKKAILTTIPKFRIDYLPLKDFMPFNTGRESTRAKPHPIGFSKILDVWNLKPSEVLMVGDERDIDIVPAKKLGIKTILISRDGRKVKEADYTIFSLKEIDKIIKKENEV